MFPNIWRTSFLLSIVWVHFVSIVSTLYDAEDGWSCVLLYPMVKNIRKGDLVCPANAVRELLVGSGRWRKARGLTCVSSGPCQNITVPIRRKGSDLIPKRLTYTVGSDQDVVVEFEELGRDSEPIMWQKEPVREGSSWWNVANLTTDDKLILPREKSIESGLYSFAFNTHLPSIDLYRIGTVAVIRRKCPMNWYGDNCLYPCKDCMYGGICDADTGECICPPARRGEFCEEACEGDKALSDCTKAIPFESGIQICLPPPYGCSCLPGYKGLRCDQRCDQGTWGVDCLQTCSHCQSNACDSKKGYCIMDDLKICAGGLSGLPRLRRIPRVTPGVDEATVEFMEEFDGKFPNNATDSEIQSFHIKVWQENQLIRNESVGVSSPITITGLHPATEYKIAVLVDVWVSPSASCIVDGSLRGERIHIVEFTTKCPEELEPPSYVEETDVSQTGFNISITNEIFMKKKCNALYSIYVEEESSKESVLNSLVMKEPTYRVEGLKSFTNYTYHVFASSKDTGAESDRVVKHVATLPKLPVTPPVSVEEEGDVIKFSWKTPDNAEGNEIAYRYAYSMRPIGCPSEKVMWQENVTKKESVLLPKPPLDTSLQIRMQMQNEVGLSDITETANYAAPQGAPTLQVLSLERLNGSDDYRVSLEKNCSKINGDGLSVATKIVYAENIVRKDGRYDPPPHLASYCYVEDIFQCVVSIPSDLYPDTKYKLTVFASNAKGSNNLPTDSKTDIFTTSPVSPHEPRSLSVSTAHDSLTVSWEPPVDFPPTGDIEEYKIHWYPEMEKLSIGTYYTTETSFFIEGLETNTTYAIEVYAKNKFVTEFGVPAKITAKTEPHKPLPPCNITVDSNLTQAIVGWLDCDGAGRRSQFNITYTYIVNFEGVVKEIKDTHYEFVGLYPGTGYNLTLESCNRWRCSDAVSREVFTLPEEPQVDAKEFKVTESDGNFTKIILPVVKGGPADQYVVVMKDNETLKNEAIKEKSLELVKEQECVLENPQNKMCSHSSSSTDSEDAWIAKKIHNEGSGTVAEVSIGTGEGDDRSLEDGHQYKVTAVTEKKSGPYRVYDVTEPVTLNLATSVTSGITYGVIIVVIVFIVATIFVTLIFIYRRCHRQDISENPVAYSVAKQETLMPLPVHPSPPNTSSSSSCSFFPPPLPIRPSPALPLPSPPSLPPIPAEDSEEELISGDHSEGCRMSIPPEVPMRTVNAFEDMPVLDRISRRIPYDEIETHLGKVTWSHEFTEDFLRVPKRMDKSSSDGEVPANKPKNRENSTVPYNNRRVWLPGIPGNPFSDYINACYAQVHTDIYTYILTQWPKVFNENTVDDFWRLVWEFSCKIIVVTANTSEIDQDPREYWPSETFLIAGGISIVLLSSEHLMGFIIRHFKLTKGKEEKEVKQFQYALWPKDGNPENPYGLVQMLKMVKSEPKEGNRIVHSCDGMGRSAAALLALSMAEQVLDSGYLDAPKALYLLRKGKPGIVVTESQYRFAHLLCQEILFGDATSFTCPQYLQALPDLKVPKEGQELSTLQQQFRAFKRIHKGLDFNSANKSEYSHLNRNKNVLPANSKRVYLKTPDNVPPGPNSSYINAIKVQSLGHKNGYIVSEHPLPHTLSRIWRLVYTERIPCWTLIHSFTQHDEEYPSVVPEGEAMQVDELVITLEKSVQLRHFWEHHVTVSCPQDKRKPHRCTVLEMIGWPYTESKPSSLHPLLAVTERSESISRGSTHRLFTCKDGYTGCGVVMGVVSAIQRIKLCHEVDVYRAALSVSYDRPEFISSEEQYELLHDSVAVYLSELDDYQNFA